MTLRFVYSKFIKRSVLNRFLSLDANNETEARISDILKKRFPNANTITVTDISGGCGAMFEVFIESIDFKAINTVKQHMLVNDALKDQIKDMHGIRIFTSIPDNH